MSLRRHRTGKPMKVVEMRCPRCKRGLLCSEGEATPPIPGQVPYCADCLKEKIQVVMERRVYRSGPIDLHV